MIRIYSGLFVERDYLSHHYKNISITVYIIPYKHSDARSKHIFNFLYSSFGSENVNTVEICGPTCLLHEIYPQFTVLLGITQCEI